MKAIELKNQLLNYSDEELFELDIVFQVYIEEEEDYYISNDFFLLRKIPDQYKLLLTNVDEDY